MKEIVIKIDDGIYKLIMSMDKSLATTAIRPRVFDIIRNGKELPKGHGELIDARAFLQSINSNDYDTYNDYSNTFDWIEGAETLVEADKGDTE